MLCLSPRGKKSAHHPNWADEVAGVLLDTNVLSELMRPRPDVAVVAWFQQRPDLKIFTSVITQAEILLGIALLPGGRRRIALAVAAEQMFKEEFAGRCLPFDHMAAAEYALLIAARKKIGKPISTEDAQIAAIAILHNLPLVTRNTKDFLLIENLQLIDPWISK